MKYNYIISFSFLPPTPLMYPISPKPYTLLSVLLNLCPFPLIVTAMYVSEFINI